MSKILIVITGQNGILNASLELARRLKVAGHELHLAAPRPVGERIVREGWTFTELPEVLMEPSEILPLEKAPLGKLKGLVSRFMNRRQLRKKALENTRPIAFRALAEKLQPDLLLIDIELHEYIIASHGMGLNYVLLSQWYSLWRRPGLPYQLTHTIPGVDPDGTPAAIEEEWNKITSQRRDTFRRKAQLSFGADRRSTLLKLAKENNFPLDILRENYWPGAFTYDRLPVIAMAPLEVEFPHEPRPNLHYVGPMVFANRQENQAASHRGVTLADILQGAKAAQHKVIVVTVSTLSGGDTDFLRRLVKAVAGQEKYQVVLGLGGKLKPEDLTANAGAREGTKGQGDLPSNVHAFSYIPQLRALASADLSINHGGIHTIHECLHFAVPMLVYSGKRSDQPGCAARVHYHGLGLMADKDMDSSDLILEKISQVLSGAVLGNVQGMHQQINHYQADGVVEKVVEEFLRKKKNQ